MECVETVMFAELWETMFAGCGKAGGFSIGREYLLSIGGAAVFHISIAQNGQRTLLSVAFPCRKMYNEYS